MAPVRNSLRESQVDGGSNQLTTRATSNSSKAYDIERYRQLVPIACKEGITYLNAALQPPLNNVVRDAIDNFLEEGQSLPYPKPKWVQHAEETRDLLGIFLNVESETLAFTRDTTEALNMFQRSLILEPGDNVIVLDVEHPNQTYGWLALASEKAIEVRQVSTNGKEMFANAASFEPLVDSRTKAIGLSSIMFHSGQKNDVRDICAKFRSRGIHVLVDITQDVGVGPVDLQDLNVSAAAFSCHKALGCPSGLGVLYINAQTLETLKSVPPIVGAGSISNLSSDVIIDASKEPKYYSTTRRYEHTNIPFISIHALYASLRFYLEDVGLANVERHLRALGRALVTELKPLGVQISGPADVNKCAPHLYVLEMIHPSWEGHFRTHGIVLSCYPFGIRVSFGFYNDESDVKALGTVIRTGIAAGLQLR